ncbi:hypothetical protein NPIL_670651 [Nephila pilipes]|uniref:Uncharacterized protein n=1 Tax=Nephila pilipes TaxID=299642 RepID=A0A8X6TPA8_NEPPI|nr:hypothetical protein NPIL_670651 [Nephila pilipes]
MIALRGEIAALSKQVERLSRDRSRNRSRRRYGKSPCKTPSRWEDYNFNDDFCYYHNRFGSKAKKCREPCTFAQAPENLSLLSTAIFQRQMFRYGLLHIFDRKTNLKFPHRLWI